jgi:hypothetical protein
MGKGKFVQEGPPDKMRPLSNKGQECTDRTDAHHESHALDRVNKGRGSSITSVAAGARGLSTSRSRRGGSGDERGTWVGNARLSSGFRIYGHGARVQLGVAAEIARGSGAVLALVVQGHDVRQLISYYETGDEFNLEAFNSRIDTHRHHRKKRGRKFHSCRC